MVLNLFLYLLFITFSFGQLGRMSFLGQQLNGYFYEIFITIILFLLFIKYRTMPLLKLWKNFKIIIFFFVWFFISYIVGIYRFSLQENLVGVLYLLRLLLYFLFFLYLSYLFTKNKHYTKVLINGIFIFIIFTLFSSFVQYFFYKDLRNLIYQGWDPHLFRMFGVFYDTSVSGAVYGLLFLAVFLLKDKLIQNKLIRYIVLSLLLISVVLTYNRSLYLAFVLLSVSYLFTRRMFKIFFILVGLIALLIITAPKPYGEGVNLLRTASITGRIEDYQSAFKIASREPIFGIGYNRLRYVKLQNNIIPSYNSDLTHSGASFSSSFLIILVGSGVIGLLLFVVILYKVSAVNEFSRYLIVYLSILSMFDNILLQPFILFLLLIYLSIFSVNLFDKKQSGSL